MTVLDDTQPRRPANFPTSAEQTPPNDGAPGCGIWGCLGAIAVLFAITVVGLAAAAGWTTGQRDFLTHATGTKQADLVNQIAQISTDVANGNVAIVDIRLRYLATQTPGVPQLPQLNQTGTALSLTQQPTPTPSPTLTPEATPTATVEVTAETVIPTADQGGINLTVTLDDAQKAIAEARYDDAIELLDIIIDTDPNFQRDRVRGLMLDTLNTHSLALFRLGDETILGRAIFLANRAEEFGTVDGNVQYEAYIASLYLQAKATIRTNDFTGSIRVLTELYNQTPNYLDVTTLLMSQYIAYGDALVAGGQACNAIGQYDLAINIGSGTAPGKRTAAQTACDLSLTGTPAFLGTPDTTQPAPIGQP